MGTVFSVSDARRKAPSSARPPASRTSHPMKKTFSHQYRHFIWLSPAKFYAFVQFVRKSKDQRLLKINESVTFLVNFGTFLILFHSISNF